jgi:hypothetical protein
MKKVNFIFCLSLFIFLIAAGCRQFRKEAQSDTTNVKGGSAEITFNTLEHDFGKITEGEKVACVFSFENTGLDDLVIVSATTSCGCTVPEFDDKPISPGGKGTMEVVFDSSGRSGMQTKTITVRSNADKQVMILKITAEVITNTNQLFKQWVILFICI